MAGRGFAWLLAFAGTALAQDPVIRTAASEVLVDVVVRDKKGALVKGLGSADFRVLEDGVAQQVVSVREVATQGALVRGAAPTPITDTVDTGRQIRLFTLAFDRLGIDSRRLARQAAHDMLKEDLGPNTYIAVFATDQRLQPIQTFTRDLDLLRKAVDAATSGAPTDYANATAALETAVGSTSGAEGSAAAAANSGGQQVDGGGMAAEAMNRMVRDMLDFASQSTREQSGRASLFGLWAIVKEQHRLPGRKAVLYFSEGMDIPNAIKGQFHNMISSANRANVSVYAIDSRGLSVANDNAAGEQMLSTNARLAQGWYQRSTSNAMTREQVQQMDRVEDAIRANRQLALAELAEGTGGFLIANTNDFRRPLRRLVEELGSYYEVVYRPLNADMDGSFRKIEVRIPDRELAIQARSGYFALPTVDGRPVLAYEYPMLKALNTRPLARGLDFGAGVLEFRPRTGGREAALIFDLPLEQVAFRKLEAAYRTHFSFLALVKDSNGHVVGRISRDLPLEEPLDRLAGFQKGRAIFTEKVDLPVGRYTVESAVADRVSEKVAARRSVLVVSEPASGIGLSSLVLARRVEPAPPTVDPGDVFLGEGKKVTPMLGDRISGGPGSALSVYMVLYPDPAIAATPRLQIDFYRDGQRLGGGAPQLGRETDDGRIPYLAVTPLEGFTPGQYEVRATATQGVTKSERSLFVTIE